ncbi:hypothetical protein VTL71DRAFT_10396 [Oculimacula yallundae]|uniref:Cytochrome P450 n=1 Tax=Oculimacula yallundae TaxID=86028 RepID=A0ABR4CTF2_9HELO
MLGQFEIIKSFCLDTKVQAFWIPGLGIQQTATSIAIIGGLQNDSAATTTSVMQEMNNDPLAGGTTKPMEPQVESLREFLRIAKITYLSYGVRELLLQIIRSNFLCRIVNWCIVLYIHYRFFSFIFRKLIGPREVVIRDADQAHALLTTTHFTLRSRYFKPMAKLFKIENGFTTTSSPYRTHFVRETNNLLIATSYTTHWTRVATEAKLYIQDRVARLSPGESLPLRSMCQNLAFRISLVKLFRHQMDAMPSETDIEFIVSRLHSLFGSWQKPSSLRNKEMIAKEERGQRELMAKLNEVFNFPTGQTMHPRENPLNHLLTAHSALDRIIMRCFLECRFRNSDKMGGWRDEEGDVRMRRNMMRLLNEPTEESFKDDSNGLIAIKDIVSEALRLYPSGSHLRRKNGWFMWRFWEAGRMYVADIESIHRDPKLWKCSAEEAGRFDPRRWRDLPAGNSKRFMPFGVGFWACPTRKSAGPMMIGISVAALMSAVGEDFELAGEGSRTVLEGEGTLLSGRDEYAGLRLRRKKGKMKARISQEEYDEVKEEAEYAAAEVRGRLYPATDLNVIPLGDRVANGANQGRWKCHDGRGEELF